MEYAQYQWTNQPETSGIVINISVFANGIGSHTEGKALTHLIGNYLGLYPLTGEHQCGDDYVDDTPIHPIQIPECFEEDVISSCDNKKILVNNFMAYSPDTCKDSFTIGQWKRMLFLDDYYSTLKTKEQ